MKKIALKSIMFLFMAIFTGITFFACNDDEKEERKEPTTDSIRIEGKIIGILGYCEGNRVVLYPLQIKMILVKVEHIIV